MNWYNNPIDWDTFQWHFYGTLFTDMSVAYGQYLLSFAANLKEHVRKEAPYLVCGNKDDILLEALSASKSLSSLKTLIFLVKGNKQFIPVDNVDLNNCRFDGTRDSEVHYKIFIELEPEFINHLKFFGLLKDTKKSKSEYFKVLQKRLPENIVQKISTENKNALFAGMFDGDGSIGINIKCPFCKKNNGLYEELNCKNCGKALDGLAKNASKYLCLDSTHLDVMEEEISFVKYMNMKGHLYVFAVRKEAPDKLKKIDFDAKLAEVDCRIESYRQLEKFQMPIIINKHILPKTVPSYHYAPDVYSSVRFAFSPYFRKNEERLNWYGMNDLNSHNYSILSNCVNYMKVKKKFNILTKILKNRSIVS